MLKHENTQLNCTEVKSNIGKYKKILKMISAY